MNAWRSHQRTPPLRTTLENNIVNALMGMLYQPEEPRLTQAELDERVEEFAQFQDIPSPLNTICSITQDAFEPTQRVARVRHCGHIFNYNSLHRWLRVNNTCPTCRHNLRSSSVPDSVPAPSTAPVPAPSTAPATAPSTAPATTRRGISIPLESDIDINTFYNELLRNRENLPGFELNAVNDDSIVFSFDLTNRPSANGPRNIDDVD